MEVNRWFLDFEFNLNRVLTTITVVAFMRSISSMWMTFCCATENEIRILFKTLDTTSGLPHQGLLNNYLGVKVE